MAEVNEIKCPFCAELIKADAVKCRFCGEFLDKAKAELARPTTPNPEIPHEDTKVFEGSASGLCMIWPGLKFAFWIAVAIVLATYIKGLLARSLEAERVVRIIMNSIGALIGLVALVLFLKTLVVFKTTIYRISNDRVELERGVFSKSVQNVEMWRVQDVGFHQPWIQRIVGLGKVSIVSTDKSDPRINVGPIKNSRAVYDVLKKAQYQADRRRGVVHLEQ